MPRIVDHDQRRWDLLDRAFPLFAQHGYHALSVRKLADGLGVSTGVLYHYFDSKQAVFVAMVRQRVEEQVERSLAALERAEPGQASADLLRRFVQDEADELAVTLQLAFEFKRHDPDAAPFLTEVLGTYQQAMVQHYGVSPDLAPAVMSLALGGLAWRLLDPQGSQLEQQLALLLPLLSA